MTTTHQSSFRCFFYPNLNFKHHIVNLKSKLSKALYALRTAKNTLSSKSLLLIYNSIFHCHLLYAIQIWSCSRSGPINELFKMQKKAIRIVSGSSYNSHTEPLFKKLGVLPLPDLISITKIQFMQRFKQKFLPTSFDDTWVVCSPSPPFCYCISKIIHVCALLAPFSPFPLKLPPCMEPKLVKCCDATDRCATAEFGNILLG